MDSTDLVKKGATAVAPLMDMSNWGGVQEIDPRNVTIPKITLMQPMSPPVQENDDINAGDFVFVSDNKVACKKGKSLEFIPLFCVEKWKTEKKQIGSQGMFTWVSTELKGPHNPEMKKPWTEDGFEYRQSLVQEWICLLSDDIKKDAKAREELAKGKMPKLSDALMPTVIPFKRTSLPASKTLYTAQAMAQGFGVPLAGTTFKLGTEFVKDENYSYFVSTVEQSRQTTEEELKVAANWFKMLYQSRAELKVDDSDEKLEEVTHPRVVNEALTVEDIPF